MGIGLLSSCNPAIRQSPQCGQSARLETPGRPRDEAGHLLWGRYRGLAFYAPILLLAGPGWVVLLVRRCWDVAVVTLLVVVSVLLVNLFYPEWTGGWSTGPRLLLPLYPFAMLPVAALLAGSSRWARLAAIAALGLAVAGGIEMFLFQGVGGRIPADFSDPLLDVVWPLWTGQPLPIWRDGERFSRNLVSVIAPGWIAGLEPAWQCAQFLPLVLVQVLAILGLRWLGSRNGADLERSEVSGGRVVVVKGTLASSRSIGPPP